MAVTGDHKYFATMVELSLAERKIQSAKKALEEEHGYSAAMDIREAAKHLAEAGFKVTEKIVGSH